MSRWNIIPYSPKDHYLRVCRWVQKRVSQTQGHDGFCVDRWETQFSPERLASKENNNALVFMRDELVGLIVGEGPEEFHFLRLEHDDSLLKIMVEWVQDRLHKKPFFTWSAASNPLEAKQLQKLGFEKQSAQCCNRTLQLTENLVELNLPDEYRLINIPVADLAWAQKQATIDQQCFPWANSSAAFVQDILKMPSYRPEFHKGVITSSGELAAFSILWIDSLNRLAVFEPVATLAAHRRLGLAKTMMNAMVRQAFEELGITRFLVGSYSDEAHATYESVGFTDVVISDQWQWPGKES